MKMKKKIFLTSLLVVAFICIFAISAFAEEIISSKTVSAEYGTVIQLTEDPGLDNAKQYVSTLNKISDTGDSSQDYFIATDGTYFYVFPSSYIVYERADGKLEMYAGTESKPGLAQALEEFNLAMNTTYYDDYSVTGSYGGTRINEIVRFEFPIDVTFSHPNWCCMRQYPNLVEVRFNHHFGAVANGMFQNSTKLKTVIGFEKVDSTQLGTQIFFGCTGLEYVKLPISITKIPNSTFWGAGKLVIANLSELTQLTTIGTDAFRDGATLNFVLPDSVTTIEARAFQSAVKKGGSFTINKTSKLEEIGDEAFCDCRKIASIYIPSTVTSIGKSAFKQNYALKSIENLENCLVTELKDDTFASVTQITTIKLPKNLTTIGLAFSGNEKLQVVYIPDTVTSIVGTFTGSQYANTVYIYTGKNVSALSACERIANANAVEYDYNNPDQDFLALAKEKGGCVVVYGYDKCKAFYNNVHNYTVGTGDCMDGVGCKRCPSKIAGTTAHKYYETLVYASFASNGIYDYGCSNEGCTKYDVYDDKVAPIFVAKGYSNSDNGIAGGYTVNIAAYNNYVDVTGKTITFGVLMLNPKYLEGKDSFFNGTNVNIDGTKGYVKVDMTNLLYKDFTYSITGFGADSKDVDLVVCAFAYVDGEKVEFIQDQTTNCANKKVTKNDATLYTVTFNTVEARPGNVIAGLVEYKVPGKED